MSGRLLTLGQPTATEAVRAFLAAGFPHAVLFAGPAGVGKTTLALDVAAALLCTADEPADRPCRTCRGCRMVDHGNHPDLHRLGPSGAAAAIPIGGRGERGVRDLVGDLALLPVEGGARVAIVEAAQRMSEDAQSALLKTLEEPPRGAVVMLCADDEERLLPTIRSRCARVRLGPLATRDVEAVLVTHGVADAPTAARLARISDGRPGHAIAYALAPGAAMIRGEIARTLLDLLRTDLTARLTGIRDLAGRAADLGRELDAGSARAAAGLEEAPATGRRVGQGRSGAAPRSGARASGPPSGGSAATATAGADPGPGDGSPAADAAAHGAPAADPAADSASAARVPAAERRRGALVLVRIWRSLLRDLALAGQGANRDVRDLDLIDDLEAIAASLPASRIGELLRDLDEAGERLEGNVSPELVLDVLALRWTPGRRAA